MLQPLAIAKATLSKAAPTAARRPSNANLLAARPNPALARLAQWIEIWSERAEARWSSREFRSRYY
jgi:hypothetical protein